MRFTGQDIFVGRPGVGGFKDAILEIARVLGSLLAEKVSQVVVAAVAGLGIGAPSAPDTLITGGAANVELARLAVRDHIHPGHAGQGAFP